MKTLFAKSAIALAVLAASAVSASAFGGAFGSYFYSDGSQQRLSRTVAGAAPNARATAAGVRCSYQYFIQNGERVRYEICN